MCCAVQLGWGELGAQWGRVLLLLAVGTGCWLCSNREASTGLSCCKPAHALLLLLQWEELIERCQEAGVDAFEINFSCPHGMPERRMGMAMGQV